MIRSLSSNAQNNGDIFPTSNEWVEIVKKWFNNRVNSSNNVLILQYKDEYDVVRINFSIAKQKECSCDIIET